MDLTRDMRYDSDTAECQIHNFCQEDVIPASQAASMENHEGVEEFYNEQKSIFQLVQLHSIKFEL